MPIKWIFNAVNRPPGDLLMLTAALREIHRSHPGIYRTDVRSDFPALWESNPHVTPISDDDPDREMIEFVYPGIQNANDSTAHFLDAFINHLNEDRDLRLELSEIRGEVYLSNEECSAPSMVEQITGEPLPFWIVVSGGKYDSSIKWWDHNRLQEVVDHFKGSILFAQVGQAGFYHPPLSGVLDLRGQTDMRELAKLVYHSDGVVSPITFLMHLNAAVPLRDGRRRGGVTIAGGREPLHWFSYPTHQVLHTIGALPCCAEGGCWKSRTSVLEDGAPDDEPDRLCTNAPNGRLPRCMDLITVEQVVSGIRTYYDGAVLNPLPAGAWSRVEGNLSKSLTEQLLVPGDD